MSWDMLCSPKGMGVPNSKISSFSTLPFLVVRFGAFFTIGILFVSMYSVQSTFRMEMPLILKQWISFFLMDEYFDNG